MEFWFSELHTGNVKLSVRIENSFFPEKANIRGSMCLTPRSLESLFPWTGRSYSLKKMSLFMMRW